MLAGFLIFIGIGLIGFASAQLTQRVLRSEGGPDNATLLAKLEQNPEEDIPVAADTEADREIVVELCRDLGTRGVGVGPLSLARYLEGFTAVLLTINKLYRAQAGIRFTGLP